MIPRAAYGLVKASIVLALALANLSQASNSNRERWQSSRRGSG
jgi:hypothetical protein